MGAWQNVLGGAVGAALVAGIFSIIRWNLDRKAQKEDKKSIEKTKEDLEIDNLIIAARILLYDRIKHLGNSYIRRGWVSVEEMEDLEKMHSVYHNNLHGNGFLDALMAKVKELPAYDPKGRKEN